MNTSPILGPEGQPIQESKPQTMAELLERAREEWKFKRRDKAFSYLLNAMALMSEGVAQSLKRAEESERQVERMRLILKDQLTNEPKDNHKPQRAAGDSGVPVEKGSANRSDDRVL